MCFAFCSLENFHIPFIYRRFLCRVSNNNIVVDVVSDFSRCYEYSERFSCLGLLSVFSQRIAKSEQQIYYFWFHAATAVVVQLHVCECIRFIRQRAKNEVWEFCVFSFLVFLISRFCWNVDDFLWSGVEFIILRKHQQRCVSDQLKTFFRSPPFARQTKFLFPIKLRKETREAFNVIRIILRKPNRSGVCLQIASCFQTMGWRNYRFLSICDALVDE